jgi:calcineurin-like phosphoesterase family protein
MIYLSSDLHFGHNREFIYSARGFSSVEEMNEAIIERFNSVVKEDDDFYLLGDLMLGDNSNIDYVKRLNGRIHIVLGNHDTSTREELYKALPNVVEVRDAIKFKYNKLHFYCSHYPTITGNLEKEYLHQCTLNLYGHTHQNNNFYYDLPFCYHVGVDSHECTPISIETVIKEMIEQINKCKACL